MRCPNCGFVNPSKFKFCGECGAPLTARAPVAAKAKRKTPEAERQDDAEQYRLKGELLLMQAVPDTPQAEACFRQALDIAQRQQAKSWELRAAMSLARLWKKQSKRAEARALLAEVYNWFTEGFNTADLQEAKVLLEKMS